MRILFVSANPHFTEKLDLEEEMRTLQRCLRGHDVGIKPLPAAQIEDLEEALTPTATNPPFQIVHFCGHADGKNGLYFRDPEGLEAELPPEKLREILDNKHVKLVVLNACKTDETAKALMMPGKDGKAAVDAVISTQKKLDDNVGVLMTKVLYSELGDKVPLADACKKAEEIITAPNKTERDKSRWVYELQPPGTKQVVFENRRAPETDSETQPKIDETERKEFNRYFYINYLDEQIDTLTKNRATNRLIFWVLLVGAIFLLILLPDNWRNIVYFFATDTWQHIKGFPRWLFDLLYIEAANTDSRPLLESLQILGQAIPVYFAVLQARWRVHGGIKLRQLKALKELLKKSDEMDPSLQARLDKIMDESVRAADADWKPLFGFIKPLLGFIYEVIGADQRSKNTPTQEPETGKA